MARQWVSARRQALDWLFDIAFLTELSCGLQEAVEGSATRTHWIHVNVEIENRGRVRQDRDNDEEDLGGYPGAQGRSHPLSAHVQSSELAMYSTYQITSSQEARETCQPASFFTASLQSTHTLVCFAPPCRLVAPVVCCDNLQAT
jgi:hypothetical protein